MSSQQQPLSSWSSQENAGNQSSQVTFGESSSGQSTTAQSGFGSRFELPPAASLAYGAQPDGNVLMQEYSMEVDATPAATWTGAAQLGNDGVTNRPTPRVKYGRLDWNAQKETIRQLYMEQDKTLTETIDEMKSRGFAATPKVFKVKLKEWGWQKNLPAETALLMLERAKRRKRDQDKDTIFTFGGRIWDSDRVESTVTRTQKKLKHDEDQAAVATPPGVSYKTPKPIAATPAHESDMESSGVEDIEISDDDNGDRVDENFYIGRPTRGQELTLTWNGHSRSDLHAMWGMARSLRDGGKLHEAEDTFQQVHEGMTHVLGKTNTDTVKVAFALADLYANTGRTDDALNVVEKVIQTHIATWGYDDKKTQQIVLHAVELLNAWGRPNDAMGLLSLSDELLQQACSHRGGRTGRSAKGKEKATESVVELTQSIREESSSAGIDYGLSVVRSHIAAKDNAAEGLLNAIISQSEDKSEMLLQHVKARAELLKLYEKLGLANEKRTVFADALQFLTKTWSTYVFDEDKIESFDIIEAGLQLVANALKVGYRSEARHLFRKTADKASGVFGVDDERTVWVLITIGLVYQTHMTWYEAEEWFEEAFGAVLGNKYKWSRQDGIVRSLQNAMDRHHFSYLSDEGRPFKTIFGVSGIKIVPGRLHLE